MLETALSDPNVAFLLVVMGALGVFWEIHAPGTVLAGVAGVLLLAAGAYGMWENSPNWTGLRLLLLAALFLLVETKYYTHMVSGIAGAVLLGLGAMAIFAGPRRVDPGLAAGVSIAFGAITIFLGYLGMRARRSRYATGLEGLVGEVGVARTEINLDGMILVHGEYWKAHSEQAIAAGKRVAVERVKDLIVFVREA